ncbi:uncharacterized protein [Drosophila virilis]|uniref:Uncharacterized protein n=1 Tax=Drosophila virilis TaxID=7244 RepID=A0A0Q9WGF3_DROVI|nr:uncharacterized protein LOC26530865 [Drosophila virilis]KRF79552.1 uncharacterized protein Dvir_GJ26095 [Drosophila virilis]
MERGKRGAKSFIHKPAVRIGIVVLVVHAVCWIGWSSISPGVNNTNHAARANAQHQQIRAAMESNN